jgi:hypothetical protein
VAAAFTSSPSTSPPSGGLAAGSQQLRDAERASTQRDRQGAANGPEVAFKTDLSQHEQIRERRTGHLPACDQDADGDREVETGTRLGSIGRGMMDKPKQAGGSSFGGP